MIPIDRFPTLAETLEGIDDPRAIKDLIRGLIKAAAAWSLDDDGPPPTDLVADVRHAMTLDLGRSMLEHLGLQLHRLTPDERN